MGTFVFKWPHPEAKEVYVTGTFDDWGRTEKLNKVGDTFEKEVYLSDASQKILYKFVVDDDWTIDKSAPQEGDGDNNVNNILKPEDITKKSSNPVEGGVAGAAGGVAAGGVGTALLSSTGPDSTTAQLAGQVPKESERSAPSAEKSSNTSSVAPGAFPETPSHEPESFSVNPIPASAGAGNPISLPAGEKIPDHKEVTENSVESQVTTSKEDYEKGASSDFPGEQSVGVNPLPASEGIGNPVSIPAGEQIKDSKSVQPGSVDDKVTTSKEDYEKGAPSDFPGEQSVGVNPLPASEGIGNPVSIPAGEQIKDSKNLQPGSVDDKVTTSKEDYEKAGSAALPVGLAKTGKADDTEASEFSNPEKSKNLIPESSLPMSDGPNEIPDVGPFIQSSGPGSTTAALAGQVPLEPKPEKGQDKSEVSPFIQSSGAGTSTAALAGQVPLEEDNNKTEDKEEASPFVQSSGPDTSTAALAGKVPLEKDRDESKESSVAQPFIQSSGPGTTTAALAGQVPLEKDQADAKNASEAQPFVQSSGPEATTATFAGQVPKEPKIDESSPAKEVPEVVKESISESHQSPEAAASAEAVEEKKAVEAELLKEVKTSDAAGEPAPTIAAATSTTAPTTTEASSKTTAPLDEPTKAADKTPEPSGDVSPLETETPVATAGAVKAKPEAISTPKKTDQDTSTPASPATNSTSDKKSKRRSIFGKLSKILKGDK